MTDKVWKGFPDWNSWVVAHNANVAAAAALPYHDALRHESVTMLPSAHPWWLFQHYLWLRQCYLSALRATKSYRAMLAPNLNAKTRAQMRFAAEESMRNSAHFQESYRNAQRKLVV